MSAPKPFVQAACVCEKVLIEPDGVASLIRIVDTYTVDPVEHLPDHIGVRTDLNLFIALKSGDVIGEFDLGLRLRDPDGKVQPTRTWPVALNGGEHGANAKISLVLLGQKFGLFWADVLWGEETLTSVPFRIKPGTREPVDLSPTEIGQQ